MALGRYEHTGNAPSTGLASGMGAADTTFAVNSGTGYPTGAVGDFVISLDPGTNNEEKVLCSARSGATFTVASRGYDNTIASAHSAGSTNVQHVMAAAEIDDASGHINTSSRDDHTQYARVDGTRAFTGPITVIGGAVASGGVQGASVTALAALTGNTLAVTGSAAITGALAGSSSITGTVFDPTGITGATGPGRYPGMTASGAPVTGTFLTGDVVPDNAGAIWVCTAGGSPGTWVQVGAQHTPSTARSLCPATNLTTTSATATEISTTLRCTVTVGVSGVVDISQSAIVQNETNTATPNVGLYVQVVGGSWFQTGGQPLPGQNTDEQMVGGYVFTGLTAGSTIFAMGWSTDSSATVEIKASSQVGSRQGTWMKAVAF